MEVRLISGGQPGGAAARDFESLRARAEANSPAIAAGKSRYEAAERTLELEVRKQYPDLTVGPGFEREEGVDKVLLNLSLPIPVLNANRRAIAEAGAAREAARAELEAALEHLLSDLAVAERELLAAAAQRRTLEEEIVPLVDAQYADARRVAQLGEISTLVLLETLTRQHDAKLRLIESHQADVKAAIRFDELVGPVAQETP
jgi:CRISPR system Cascade subunit CasA